MTWLCTLLTIGCASGTIQGAAKAIDGDTLSIGTQHIRLAGIDAEELNEPHGQAARAALAWIIDGQIITCDWSGYSHKRLVGVCRTPATDSINAAMVASGHALDCHRYSRGIYRTLEPAGVRTRLIQKGYCDG